MSLDYPFADAPAIGHTVTVAPGVLWLRMPLPFALDHVNLWLIEDGTGWAVVDTGVPDRRSRELWQAVFDGPMAGRPITRLLVTHFHPDHIGLAAWLQRRFGVALETTLGEWLYGRMLSLDSGEAFTEASLHFYRGAGFDDALMEVVRQRGNAYAAHTRHIPANCLRIRDGETLRIGGRGWRVIVGEGHSPEMACLWCEESGLLISGDQILPSISPNISIWPSEPEADHLTEFLASLNRFAELPADTLVLPSHGLPFRGLRQRVAELAEHHAERLVETLDACATPITAHELLARLFPRPLDSHQMFFALGESLAHLHCLRSRGQVSRETDAAGVHRYRRS
jgi:glyoxylase-like metal-dependent hydrolase (beta-lactamase superfamily II)